MAAQIAQGAADCAVLVRAEDCTPGTLLEADGYVLRETKASTFPLKPDKVTPGLHEAHHLSDVAIQSWVADAFGLPISRVQDVFMPERLTRVPLSPEGEFARVSSGSDPKSGSWLGLSAV